MLTAFKHELDRNFPALKKSNLLVGISGGLDSTVLAYLCKKTQLQFSLAHCNFSLRGDESDLDEAAVRKLGELLGVKVLSTTFSTQVYAKENGLSIQMAARELRYRWFEELQEQQGFDFVLTAHHADDDLETFLINLTRGTGLEGLTGIPARNNFIVRPLLGFSRKEIENYARENGISWREDSSNSSTKYFRNKIRHEVIPRLEELNPMMLERFKKTRQHLEQSSQLLEDYISVVFSRTAKEFPGGYSFNIKMLNSIPHTDALLYELFKTFGFTQWEDVVHLLDAQPGKLVFSKTHRLIRDREELLLTKIPPEESPVYEIPEGEEVIMLPMGTLQFEKVEEISGENKNMIFVDRKKLRFPLLVRKWQKGDFFHPFGMEGKKKLSKYFKDKKLSLPEKENCWFLCSDTAIVWVMGYRPDSRFKVDRDTEEIFKITFTS